MEEKRKGGHINEYVFLEFLLRLSEFILQLFREGLRIEQVLLLLLKDFRDGEFLGLGGRELSREG